MDIQSIALGFLSGVLLALIGGLINHKIKTKSEEQKAIEKAEYELFLKLNDLYQWYFWLATNELHKKETDDEIITTIHKIAVDIGQELHKNEDSEFTEQLLRILYDESYETYTQRWKEMSSLSEVMGKKVTPKHHKYLKQLNDSNLTYMAKSGFTPKAPGTSRFRLRV
ncbi:hypothetical protein [Vreelandella nigrificans]|uniref:Uncharacterized protein n=1 Tax=Vreelandella nigrificans TaxID=2042704 RepID=A0A2A4HT03_9GAMM|nr:hypothetical protein [Halomonas nigrificans]PCF97375.1 hypothetical protein CPA45_01125 [Halomonas nigrificans]